MNILTEMNNCLSRSFEFGEIASKSPDMDKIFNVLPLIANCPSNVLMLGEPGTGKKMLAKTIHCLGPRHDQPFVTANCSAIHERLIDCELFGCKAGAFPGIDKDMPGRFANADRGSLFLDEIGDIPPRVQAKLIRVIQAKDYESLGSRKLVKANVRIIAASSKDLEAMVSKGIFRKDLYYRLNVIVIPLPPLRERKMDIPMLIAHFVRKYNRLQEKAVMGVSDAALELLMQYDYPGNIRELENIIENSFAFSHSGYIRTGHLPDKLFVSSDKVTKQRVRTLRRPQPPATIERQAAI